MAESDLPAVIQSAAIECVAEPKVVKCINCGFASKRALVAIHPSVNREYSEIPFDERQPDGILAVYNRYYGSQAHTSDIACFRGKIDLGGLAEQRFNFVDKPIDLSQLARWELRGKLSKEVLEEDRTCEYWYQYVEGRTPQEHLADYMWEQLEKRRQEFEERLSQRAEAVQLQLAERDEQLQFQRDREQARNTKLVTRITLIGVFIAVAQVLTLTKDSVLWKLVAAIYHRFTGH